jgi:hypothetical protein
LPLCQRHHYRLYYGYSVNGSPIAPCIEKVIAPLIRQSACQSSAKASAATPRLKEQNTSPITTRQLRVWRKRDEWRGDFHASAGFRRHLLCHTRPDNVHLRLGRACRACAEDLKLSQPADQHQQHHCLTFVIGAALAGVAAVLLGMQCSVINHTWVSSLASKPSPQLY